MAMEKNLKGYIEVDVEGLSFISNDYTTAVVLKEKTGDRRLPIIIGPTEAKTIAFEIRNTLSPRPLSHDLLYNILLAFKGSLEKVLITEIKKETFYANMDIIQPDKTHILVDSRPSDAIAIALKAKAPIYVSESVMSIAGQIITEEQSLEDLSEKKREKMAKHETVLKPSEVMELEKKMQEAIKLENYEQAAQLRDQINEINRKKLKNSGEQSNVQG